MTTPSLHGAVDLSGLARKQAAAASPAPAGASSALEITEATLEEVLQRSVRQPVIVVLVSGASPACADLTARLGPIIEGYGGALAWGTVDIDAEPALAQAFQATAVPSVLALLGGRPAPLFQGNADDAQVRSVLDQVVEVARQAGLQAGDGAAPDAAAEPEPEPLPPLHQAAHDALERDDLEGAAEAFRQALKEDPKDAEARAALAQVELMDRTRDLDAAQARAAAADRPGDVDAQLAVADLEVAAGHAEDAFARLVDTVRATAGEDRERARQRLIDLFEVVGLQDPRVVAARQALASALY